MGKKGSREEGGSHGHQKGTYRIGWLVGGGEREMRC